MKQPCEGGLRIYRYGEETSFVRGKGPAWRSRESTGHETLARVRTAIERRASTERRVHWIEQDGGKGKS